MEKARIQYYKKQIFEIKESVEKLTRYADEIKEYSKVCLQLVKKDPKNADALHFMTRVIGNLTIFSEVAHNIESTGKSRLLGEVVGKLKDTNPFSAFIMGSGNLIGLCDAVFDIVKTGVLGPKKTWLWLYGGLGSNVVPDRNIQGRVEFWQLVNNAINTALALKNAWYGSGLSDEFNKILEREERLAA